VSEGVQNARNEREKEIKELGTKPKIGYLLRMNAQITTITPEQDTNGEYSKFIFKKLDEQKKEDHPENAKIYLNICHSDKVMKPLNKNNVICSQIDVLFCEKYKNSLFRKGSKELAQYSSLLPRFCSFKISI